VSVTVNKPPGSGRTTIPGPGPSGPGSAPPAATPVIDEFLADPATIPDGGSTTLRWRVTGTDNVRLNSNPVKAAGQSVEQPRSRAVYELVAEGIGGRTARRTVAVDVRNSQPYLSLTVLGLGSPVSTTGPTIVTRDKSRLVVGEGDFAVKFQFSGYTAPVNALVHWKVDGIEVQRSEETISGTAWFLSEFRGKVNLPSLRKFDVVVEVGGKTELNRTFMVEPRER
jgi:hypothetical protein